MMLFTMLRPEPLRYASRAVAVAGVILLLAGCTPAASSTADPTSAPATESPVVDAVTPSSRVPLSCDQLATEAAITTAVGEPIGQVSAISVDYIPGLAPYATLQYGQLDCAWSPVPMNYNESPPLVTISVVPEVPTSYWTETVAMMAGTEVTQGGFAGDSYTSCTANADVNSCRLDTLVNGYWLAVNVKTWAGGVTAQSTHELFASAAAAVETAGVAGAAWVSPSDTGATGTINTAKAAMALGASIETAHCGPTAQMREHWVAQAESGFTSCTYATTGMPDGADAFVTVNYLPGGAWALPEVTAGLGGHTTAVTGLGAGAFSTPGGPGASTIVFARGSDLVSVFSTGSTLVDLTPELMLSITTAMATALP